MASESRLSNTGLEGSGKTTILHRIKLGRVMTTTDPGNGLRAETLKYRNIHFTSWDLEDKNRASWQGLVQQQDTKGLIFVVDSNDRGSMSKAKDELEQMLKQVTGKAALLVIANKQDMPNSMNAAEVAEALGLNQV